MSEYSENLNNSLTASIDWIAFTSVIIPDVKEMIEFLGYSESDFVLMPKGSNGYRKSYRLNGYPVTILSDGNDDMGIHVVISGSAIPDVLHHFKKSITAVTPFGTEAVALSDFDNTVMVEFLQQIRSVGWFTRLDMAVDDIGACFFSVEDLRAYLDRQEIVSKFRTWRDVYESTFSSEKTGHTLYFGSRQSEVMLRVYDKQLEQKQKDNEASEPEPWIRWEFELKNRRADIAADILIGNKHIGEIIMGILNNYIHIIVPDDSNRSRCSLNPLWEKFVGAVEKLSLFVKAAEKSIRDKKRWLIRQCLPTIAGVIISDGGSMDIITQHFDDAVARMSSGLRSLVSQHYPGWEAAYYGAS